MILNLRLQEVSEKCLQFHRKVVSMRGPQTDELVRSKELFTLCPYSISTRYFPLRSRDENALAVIVPTVDDIEPLGLSRPTYEQTIRFASQLRPTDAHKKRILVFPSDPPFSGDVLPAIPCWLTLAWRPRLKISELCLYFVERVAWPEETMFVGFANQ